MSVQSDKWIIQMARDNDMISPFEDKQVRGDKISVSYTHLTLPTTPYV